MIKGKLFNKCYFIYDYIYTFKRFIEISPFKETLFSWLEKTNDLSLWHVCIILRDVAKALYFLHKNDAILVFFGMKDILIEEFESRSESRCIHARLSNLPWKDKLMDTIVSGNSDYCDMKAYYKIACELGDILYSREIYDETCSYDLFQIFEDFIAYIRSNIGFITMFDVINHTFLNSYGQKCDCIEDDSVVDECSEDEYYTPNDSN